MDNWLEPLLSQGKIRRDLGKYVRKTGEARRDMLDAAERLRSFDRPALIVWTPEDRVMKRDHGHRLAERMPRARLVEITDSYTLIPEDQPGALADEIRRFLQEPAP
jgi:pimeloyl-ACP methyl ester carboxylesterase